MRRVDAFCGRCEIDENFTILDLHFVARNGRGDSRSGFAGRALKLPVVPRANDIAVVAQSPFAQRASDMIADSGNRGKRAVAIGKGNRQFADLQLLKLLSSDLLYRAKRAGKNQVSS